MSRALLTLLTGLALVGCDIKDDPEPDPDPTPGEDTADPDTGEPVEGEDEDGDGFDADEDCDDADPDINPGADEVCDGADNNCDGVVDDDAVDATTFYADGDGDGYGSDDSITACTQPTGYTDEGGDCDDTVDWIHPHAEELCLLDIDTDCDASTQAEGRITWEQGGQFWDATDTFSGTAEAPAQITIEDDVTLYACANTWYANITVDQSDGLTVIGPYGAEAAVFDGGDSTVFTISGEGDTGLTLDEVTVMGGQGVLKDDYFSAAGGGIYCRGDSTSTVSIRASTIIDNSATAGAALYTSGCDVTITETLISSNKVNYSGGIIAEGGASVHLDGVTLASNTSTSDGGALELSGDGTTALLEGVYFSSNSPYDIYLIDIDEGLSELGSDVWMSCTNKACK